MDNVLLTPHIAGATREAAARGAEVACRQLVAHLADGSLDGQPQPAGGWSGDARGAARREAADDRIHRARSSLTVDAGSGSPAARWSSTPRAASSGLGQRGVDLPRRCPAGRAVSISTRPTAGRRCSAASARRSTAPRCAGNQIAAVTAASMREGFVLYDAAGREIWACPNIDARAGARGRGDDRGGAGRAALPPRRRLDLDHRARLACAGSGAISPRFWERARHLTHARRLGHPPPERRLLHRPLARLLVEPLRPRDALLVDRRRPPSWTSRTSSRPIYEPGTVVGDVTPAGRRRRPVSSPGTPVVAGGGDTQLALLGAGLTAGLRFATVGGTFWQSAAVMNDPVVDPEIRLRTLCHVLPGAWMIEGVGFLHGFSTRWVRDGFLRAADPTIRPEQGYETAGALAAEVPGRRQRALLPLLEGDGRPALAARPAVPGRRRHPATRSRPGSAPSFARSRRRRPTSLAATTRSWRRSAARRRSASASSAVRRAAGSGRRSWPTCSASRSRRPARPRRPPAVRRGPLRAGRRRRLPRPARGGRRDRPGAGRVRP